MVISLVVSMRLLTALVLVFLQRTSGLLSWFWLRWRLSTGFLAAVGLLSSGTRPRAEFGLVTNEVTFNVFGYGYSY